MVETINGKDKGTTLEISTENGQTVIEMNFGNGLMARRKIPAVLLWKVWLAPKNQLLKELNYRHPRLAEELSQFYHDIAKQNVIVMTREEDDSENITTLWCQYYWDNQWLDLCIEENDDSFYISVICVKARQNPVVVPKNEFLEKLRKEIRYY